MARVNLGKVVPEKGVDYYTEAEKAEFKAEIEEDVTALSETVAAQGTAIATLQLDSAHTIEMTLNSTTYELTLILKNKAGTALATQTINLPNENAITNIEYSNGKLIITKQSGTIIQVDISGLINGLATETALTNLANALKETIGIQTNTYDNTKTYNTGDIVVQNEKIYKANQDNITGTFDSSKWDELSLYEYQKLQDEAIEENYKVITKLQEDVEDLTERMEDAENNEMTYTPTPATSHYLQDSADARFRKFIPIGRTTQESTTGKNKLNCGNPLAVTGSVNIPCDLPAGSYTISCSKAETTGTTNYMVQIQYEDSTNAYFSMYREALTGTLTLTKRATNIRVYSQDGYDHSQGVTTTFYDLMIRDSSITDATYEPYTGGEPAPSPSYQFPIKNTGDNGSINEKVENKNLFDNSKVLLNTSIASNGLPQTNAGNVTSDFMEVEENTSYYLSRVRGVTFARTYAFYNENKELILFDSISGREDVSGVVTTPNGTKYMRVVSGIDYYEECQVEQGQAPTSYVPHSEQNISFPLAQGQKLMEGDYLADDGVHHVRGEVVLDGTESIVKKWQREAENIFEITTPLQNSLRFSEKTANILCKSNEYIGIAYDKSDGHGSIWSLRNNDNNPYLISIVDTTTLSDVGCIIIKDKRFTTVEDLKAWLVQQYANGTPVKVQYKLQTEVIDPYTEEQKIAYPEWKKARTYKNVTHISSEDETPADVEIEYVRDINTIDDRITALEARVDLLEE